MKISSPVIALALTLASISITSVAAQERRIASPAGYSATEVGGHYDVREGYVNGRWLEIRYGRPIKRSRNLFDLPDWREALMDGAEVWRAGANVTTRLTIETPLLFANTRVEPGEYTVFIDFMQEPWLFVLSNWTAQLSYDYENKEALWGAYEYTADRDVVRAEMQLNQLDYSFDQLSWQFVDMNNEAGKLMFLWDKVQATVPFKIVD